jgi:predicted PurR-regulated permease PerM
MKRLHPYRKNPYSATLGRPSGLARITINVFVLITLAAALYLLRPFIGPIVLALFLVIVFYPVYRYMRVWLGNRKNLASIVTVVIIFLCVMIPLTLLATALVQQGVEFAKDANQWLREGNLDRVIESERVQEILDNPYVHRAKAFLDKNFAGEGETEFNLVKRLAGLSKDVATTAGQKFLVPLVSKTGLFILGIVVMFFTMFYAFRDGKTMLRYVLRLLPLSHSNEQRLLERIREISRAVLLGTFLTATAQAVVAMIAFWIIGIPALFWGTLLGIASLVPMIGTGIIWVPVVIYLVSIGNYGQAVFLTLWCALIVGLIDNFLRPILMQGRSGMSVLVLFFAILGGIRAFGPLGIIYGPIIFGLCAVALYMYSLEHAGTLKHLERS